MSIIVRRTAGFLAGLTLLLGGAGEDRPLAASGIPPGGTPVGMTSEASPRVHRHRPGRPRRPVPRRGPGRRRLDPPPLVVPPSAPARPSPPAVASVRDLGALSQPASVTARDGGASALIAGKVLWTFGDHLGATFLSNGAALADPASPHQLSDAVGVPSPLLTFTPDEQAFNKRPGNPDRLALWPSSIVPVGRGGLVFYQKVLVKTGLGGLNLHVLGTGTALVDAGSTAATRQQGLLFAAPEPKFGDAAVVAADGYLYLFGGPAGDPSAWTEEQKQLPVFVARAPLLSAGDRSAYRFWGGDRVGWVADVGQSRGVLGWVPGLSVSWSPWLGKFLAVHSETFTNRVLMHVADRPEGPWSDPVAAFTGLEPGPGPFAASPVAPYVYSALHHQELASGPRIILSYYRRRSDILDPTGRADGANGEIRLVEVTLR